MCPMAQADGHDAPGLIDEAVPGVAAVVRRQGFWDNWRVELTEALAHQGYHIRRPLLDEASGVV